MIYLFQSGGGFMWLQGLIALIVLYLSGKYICAILLKPDAVDSTIDQRLNSLLFWGMFSTVLGFFAHYLGLYSAMRVIEASRDISPAIVAGGYSASLIVVITGLLLLLASMILWLLLRRLLRSMRGRRA